MGSIRDIVVDDVIEGSLERDASWKERHPEGADRLFVSSLGHCPRSALLQYRGVEKTNPFDAYVKEVMECGNVWEDRTWLALQRRYGDRVQRNVSVRDEVWAGRIDFLLPDHYIVEHKATNPKNFRIRQPRLPYPFHALQVLAYGYLYQKQHDLAWRPTTALYYRGWEGWAEYELKDEGEFISWTGEMKGRVVSGRIPLSLRGEMENLEDYFTRRVMPARLPTPIAVPFTCARLDKKKRLLWPRCTYFGHCWAKEYPNKGPYNWTGPV